MAPSDEQQRDARSIDRRAMRQAVLTVCLVGVTVAGLTLILDGAPGVSACIAAEVVVGAVGVIVYAVEGHAGRSRRLAEEPDAAEARRAMSQAVRFFVGAPGCALAQLLLRSDRLEAVDVADAFGPHLLVVGGVLGPSGIGGLLVLVDRRRRTRAATVTKT